MGGGGLGGVFLGGGGGGGVGDSVRQYGIVFFYQLIFMAAEILPFLLERPAAPASGFFLKFCSKQNFKSAAFLKTWQESH